MTDNFYFKSKRFFKYWYPIFVGLSVCNLLLHLLIPLDESYGFALLYLIPFIHCGCICIYMFVVSVLERRETGWNYKSWRHVENVFSREERDHISSNYPEIYKNLVSDGIKVDIFALAKFKKGDYDNGKDEKLVLMQDKMRFMLFVPVFAFSLVPISWVLGLLILIVKSV